MLTDKDVVQEEVYVPGDSVIYSYIADNDMKFLKVTIIKKLGTVYFMDIDGYFIPKENIKGRFK